MRSRLVVLLPFLIMAVSSAATRAGAVDLSVSVLCDGPDLQVGVIAGDGPFDVTGSGPGLPLSNIGTEIHLLPGPAIWTNVTITEKSGNGESRNLGSFDCTTELSGNALCDGPDLQVGVIDGDAPFDVTGTGPGLPLSNIGMEIHLLPGPAIWTDVTITEKAGDGESRNFGDFDCTTKLSGNVLCDGPDLQVSVIHGDGPFDITGSGPGLPLSFMGTEIRLLSGPAIWTNVTITEKAGNGESRSFGDFDCTTKLSVSALCDGSTLQLGVIDGDGPFNVAGSGPGLPLPSIGKEFHLLMGPAVWTGISVTETKGNNEVADLGDIGCGNALQASAACNGTSLDVTVATGDVPVDVTGSGPNLPQTGLGIGVRSIPGPGIWTGLTAAEKNGDKQTSALGDFACLAPQGAACTEAQLCASGFCAQGFCCDQACDQPGQYCSLQDRQGTCTEPVAGAPSMSPRALLLLLTMLSAIAGFALRRRSRRTG